MRVALCLLAIGCVHRPAFDTSTVCGAVQDVAHAAIGDFERVRGARHHRVEDGEAWTDPQQIPGTADCKVVDRDAEHANESGRAYSCELAKGRCDIARSRFDATVRELSSCLGARPEWVDDPAGETEQFYSFEQKVRVSYSPKICGATLEIIPKKRPARSLDYRYRYRG